MLIVLIIFIVMGIEVGKEDAILNEKYQNLKKEYERHGFTYIP